MWRERIFSSLAWRERITIWREWEEQVALILRVFLGEDYAVVSGSVMVTYGDAAERAGQRERCREG